MYAYVIINHIEVKIIFLLRHKKTTGTNPLSNRAINLKKIIITILFLTLFPIISANCFAEPPLLLSTFTGPPYSTPDQSGMYDLILKEAFIRLGRKIDIIQLPAERSLTNANKGITDGDFVRISGLDTIYPNLVRVPEKLIDFEFVAFTKHVDLKTTGWETLRPYNVAIVRGWKILETNIVGAQSLIRAKDQYMLFTLMDNDRTDIVVYSRFEGYDVIRKLEMKGVKTLEPPLAVREMFLYLNKKHKKLVPLVAAIFKEMKNDGTFEKIRKQTLSPLLPE